MTKLPITVEVDRYYFVEQILVPELGRSIFKILSFEDRDKDGTRYAFYLSIENSKLRVIECSQNGKEVILLRYVRPYHASRFRPCEVKDSIHQAKIKAFKECVRKITPFSKAKNDLENFEFSMHKGIYQTSDFSRGLSVKDLYYAVKISKLKCSGLDTTESYRYETD